MKNCLHIYSGDGKGKTSAAVGLAVRFLSYGGRVLFVQFMKGSESGEVTSLQDLGASVCRLSHDYGFYPYKDAGGVMEEHDRLLAEAERFAQNGDGLLILDEGLTAYALSLLSRSRFLRLLTEKNCEIVCTGHKDVQELAEIADYRTEMRALAHPYEKGLCARRGIEF